MPVLLQFMGRPLKIYYCPPRPGDVWPPRSSNAANSSSTMKRAATSTNNNGSDAKGDNFTREKTPKPEGCRKLYAGNLAYDIDDATIVEFFKDCGEMIGLRWLVNRDTGEFRGGGYVEFRTTEMADKAMQLDGKELMGRKIRLDWTN